MRFALVGRPNCGKSMLFNQVAGYRAETGNFHGTTVTFTESRVRVAGEVIDLVDLPGTYTLSGSNPAEAVAKEYLVSRDVDVIINVADTSHLAQSLELTFELLALGRPVILALNMMDEAVRLGLKIDGPALAEKLGLSVLPLIASKGRGVKCVFLSALEAARKPAAGKASFPLVDDPFKRHQVAQELANSISTQGERTLNWRDRLDDVLLHPFWGYVALILILLCLFQVVFGIGKFLEPPLLVLFDRLTPFMTGSLGADSFLFALLNGALQGISAGVAIVLPYLVPFLVGLGYWKTLATCRASPS